MRFVMEIVQHTPLWVFILLGFLVWRGSQAMRPRTVAVWQVMIVPAIFVLMGLSSLALNKADGEWPLAAWLAAALVFGPLGFATGPSPLAVDRPGGRIRLPGSPLPLVRNVVVFTLQYGFAVAMALHPDRHATLATIARAVSGATAGYFLGWTWALWRRTRRSSGGVAAPS